MSPEQLSRFGRSVRRELNGNLLPFWQNSVLDREHGEWFWQVDWAGRPDPAES